MLQAHAWDTVSNIPFLWALGKISSLLPEDAIHPFFKQNIPDGEIAAAYALELKSAFCYCTLVDEMMYAYAYITYCPDSGYTVTTMSKFFTMLSILHYSYLKKIIYKRLMYQIQMYYCLSRIRCSKVWTIYVTLDEKLLKFPVEITQPIMLAFVDTVYANDQRKQYSATSFIFTYCGDDIIYRSKKQTVTTLTFIEAEFLATVACAKIPIPF